MRYGAVFPQTELGADPAGVRAFAQGIQAAGFDHLVAYDHVLGADPAGHPGFEGPYTTESMFHEPLVLFGYLAGIAPGLELTTGILILPQRQTALVAKQAAEVDVLSGGKLRLGVAVGWNKVEYEALGMDFHTRGRRLDEQIPLLRRLWTEPIVDFKGEFDEIVAAGINPLPVQQPIPIWIGGHSDAALRRAARLGDGHIFAQRPKDGWAPLFDDLRGRIAAEGRDPAAFGIEVRIGVQRIEPDVWKSHAEEIREVGATHISLDSMRGGLSGADEHVARLAEALDAIRA